MATNDEYEQGSILPAAAGAAIGGTIGGARSYTKSQNKAIAGLTLENAVHGTSLGLVKEHMAAEKSGGEATALSDEWKRLVTDKMEKPARPAINWADSSLKFRKEAYDTFKGEKKIHALNQRFHDVEQGVMQVTADERIALEAQLHNAAAEHLVATKSLKPLGKEALAELGEVTSKLPRGSLGKAIAGGAVLAAVGGVAAQAMFGRSERPRNSHSERIRAERAAAAAQQGMQI